MAEKRDKRTKVVFGRYERVSQTRVETGVSAPNGDLLFNWELRDIFLLSEEGNSLFTKEI